MAVRLKEGVRPLGMQPQIVLAIVVADGVWADDGDEELVVTSLADSTHSPTSLHYGGAAVDFRTNDVDDPAMKAMILQERLGADYDVIYEGTHIHVEYQPNAL